MESPPDRSLDWQPGFPVDARLTLAGLRRGRHDPTHRVQPDGTLWRTALTASGPVSYRIRQLRLDHLHVDVWGPGAAALVDAVPLELGATDHPERSTPTTLSSSRRYAACRACASRARGGSSRRWCRRSSSSAWSAWTPKPPSLGSSGPTE